MVPDPRKFGCFGVNAKTLVIVPVRERDLMGKSLFAKLKSFQLVFSLVKVSGADANDCASRSLAHMFICFFEEVL